MFRVSLSLFGAGPHTYDVVHLQAYSQNVSASNNMHAMVVENTPIEDTTLSDSFCLLKDVIHKVKMAPLMGLNSTVLNHNKLLITPSFHSVRAKYAKNDDDN